jgi:hypothetical protein
MESRDETSAPAATFAPAESTTSSARAERGRLDQIGRDRGAVALDLEARDPRRGSGHDPHGGELAVIDGRRDESISSHVSHAHGRVNDLGIRRARQLGNRDCIAAGGARDHRPRQEQGPVGGKNRP